MCQIFTKGAIMSKAVYSPGSFLTLLLEKNKLNPFKLSKDIHLSQSAVRLIVLGKTRISVPVAMRLAKYFNTTPESWLTMQMKWDLAEASKDKALINIVKNISKFTKPAAAVKKAGAVRKPAGKKPAVKKTAGKKKPASAKAKKAVKRGRPAK